MSEIYNSLRIYNWVKYALWNLKVDIIIVEIKLWTWIFFSSEKHTPKFVSFDWKLERLPHQDRN